MSTHNIQCHDKIRKKILIFVFLSYWKNFVGTEKRVRIIHGKRAIRVRAIEVILYKRMKIGVLVLLKLCITAMSFAGLRAPLRLKRNSIFQDVCTRMGSMIAMKIIKALTVLVGRLSLSWEMVLNGDCRLFHLTHNFL